MSCWWYMATFAWTVRWRLVEELFRADALACKDWWVVWLQQGLCVQRQPTPGKFAQPSSFAAEPSWWEAKAARTWWPCHLRVAPWFATSSAAQLRKQWLHSSASTNLDCPLKLWSQSPQAREAQLNSFQPGYVWNCQHSSIQIAARLLRQVILRGPITSGGTCDRTSFTRSLDMNRTFQLLMAFTGAGSKRMLDRSTECVSVAASSRTGCQASMFWLFLLEKLSPSHPLWW